MEGVLKLYCGDEIVDSMFYADEDERNAAIEYWKKLFERPDFELTVKDQSNNNQPQ